MSFLSTSWRLAPSGAVVLALMVPTTVVAAVSATAVQVPQNPNHVILGTSSVNTGDFAQATIDSTIGGAFANASSSTGRLAGQAGVVLSTGDPLASGRFQALAQASQTQALMMGDAFCDGADCLSADALGIELVTFSYAVRASGGVSAFAGDPRFDRATASIDYSFSLTSGSGANSSGGGHRSRTETGAAQGDISTQTAQLLVRPGEMLDLRMSFQVFADAALASFNNSGFSSGNVTALADFSHTLEWGGITGFQAFDAGGAEIALAPGVRFSLLNREGVDFWNAAATSAAVPEPATWALMIGGFGLAGRALRRRRCAPA